MFNNIYDEPEWTAENCNHKEGDTTFKQCGWCEHRGSGSYIYDCMLSGNCSLLKEYDDFDAKWDTPCKIASLGKDDIDNIIKSKEWEINSFKEQINSTLEEIKILMTLHALTEWKPLLPDSRPAEYFNLRDKVWVFHENKWEPGTVVMGYRHHDGCVSYILDNFPESQAGERGSWGCGLSIPCILKDAEVQYFKSHPDEFKTWTDLCDNGKTMPMETMRIALQNL